MTKEREEEKKYLSELATIQKIADLMGLKLKNRRLQEDRFYYGLSVTIEKENFSLWISTDRSETKFFIAGDYPLGIRGEVMNPYGYNEERNDKIRVSTSKTPEQIKKDIERRLVPEYLKRREIVKEKIAADAKYKNNKLNLIKYIEEKTELSFNQTGDEKYEEEGYFDLGKISENLRGDLKLYDGESFQLELKRLTKEQVALIIAVLKPEKNFKDLILIAQAQA